MNIYLELYLLEIVDLSNKIQKIKLLHHKKEKMRKDGEKFYQNYCTFDLKNRFILNGNIYKKDKIEKRSRFIWIYSTQTKDENKWIWTCENLHDISENFENIELFGTLKDNFYLLSNNSIYEFSITNYKLLNTGKTKIKVIESIFINDKVIKYKI